jgi:hypothetical protein
MGEQVKRWIVQGTAVSSGVLSKYIEKQSGIEELGHIAPDIVVVAATDSMAEHLKNEFPDLVMAPDEYLEAFIK